MERRFLPVSFLGVALALGSCACSSRQEAPPPPPAPPGAPTDGLPAGCNPLRENGVCLLPYPSSAFLKADPTTATGLRVNLSSDLMPVNTMGTPYDPTRPNMADGFSPTSEILAYFSDRIDPSTLPPIDDTQQSLSPSSATIIVDMDKGGLVEHFAEVDLQVYEPTDRQSVILRPTVRLATGRHYAVAITSSIRTVSGKVPSPAPGWQAIASGTATDPGAKAQAAKMPAIFDALAKVGVSKSDVVLAWDFTTASDQSLTRTMTSMASQTLAMLKDGPLGYTITEVDDDFSQHALTRVLGTFKVPQFISQTNVDVPAATLTFDANGDPVANGTYDAPFTIILPRAAANGPVRLLVYGHGFLGTAESELGDSTGSYDQDFADAKGYALIGTDWIGFSYYEANVNQAAPLALQDLNDLPWVSDRLHQAIVNAMVLAVTARDAIAKDPALFVGGQQVIDTSRVDYFGISLGGVMGSSLMSWSPDLARGVLNVEGAGWSYLAQRSINWDLFKLVVDASYPDKIDQQIVIELLQTHLDPVDGMSVAPGLLAMPNKQLLLQMGVDDFQVPNLATEVHARTLGIPLLSDTPISIPGLTVTNGPLPSALTVWDLDEEAPPPGNVAPNPLDTANNVHDQLRALPEVMSQIDQFQRTGQVVSTCNGPCDENADQADAGF